MSARTYRWCLFAIAAAALAVRVVYVAARWHNFVGDGFDQFWYQNLASMITSGRGISNPVVWAQQHRIVPTALHGPMTSFALVPLDVIGISTLHEHQLLMALLGTATVVLLGLLSGRLVNRGAGVATALVGAFYPGLWAFDAKVMSEPVEQFLVAISLLFTYAFRSRPTTLRAIGLGTSVGLSVLTRSELILEVLLVVVPVCVGVFRQHRPERPLVKSAVAIGVVLLVLAPWVAYCQTAFHDPEVLSTDLGVGLIQDNNPTTYYTPRIGFWFAPASSPIPPGDESQADKTFQREAKSYALSHKKRLVLVVLARVGRVWNLYEPSQTARFTALPAACPPALGCDVDSVEDLKTQDAWILSFYGLIPFAVVGLVALRRRKRIVYPLLAMGVIVTIVAIVEAGVLRFRAPFEDAFVVLAGVGLYAVLGALRRKLGERGIRIHRTGASQG